MSTLPTPSYVHLYRLASIEGELMASAALVRIAGHTDDMIRDRTALLAQRFAGWNYDSRTDMSPACQVLAERVQHLARQISPAEWQWATEYEQNNHTLAASAL